MAHKIGVLLGLGLAFAMVFGTVALVLEDMRSGNPNTSNDSPQIRITPGVEVDRLATQIAANPDDAESVEMLAETLANSGRIMESLPWYERAIELRPNELMTRIAFARTLQRAGSDFDAKLQLDRAAQISPDDPLVYFYYGRYYELAQTPDIPAALEAYEKVKELDHGSVLAEQAQQRVDGLQASPTPTGTP